VPVAVRPLPPSTIDVAPSENAEVRAVVERVLACLIEAQEDLDRLDGKIGDGDAGSTLAGAARTVRGNLDALPFADGAHLCAVLSALLTDHVGGSSGVLLAIMLAAAGDAHRGDWRTALAAGVEGLKRYGGARRGDRTLIDALEPAIEALADGLPAAAAAARAGADATAEMSKARAGRAAYIREDALTGVVDPGAEAVARIFESLAAGA
jgi:dihydroxyacetone kinase